MTTEIEKTFFKTFGIEKTCNNKIINPANCPTNKIKRCCGCDWLDYPQITERIWLELVRIYASCNIFLLRKNMEDFKYDILMALIERPYEYRKQIKELFKEVE